MPRIAFSNAQMCPLGLFLDEQLRVLVYAQEVDSRGNRFRINNGCSIKQLDLLHRFSTHVGQECRLSHSLFRHLYDDTVCKGIRIGDKGSIVACIQSFGAVIYLNQGCRLVRFVKYKREGVVRASEGKGMIAGHTLFGTETLARTSSICLNPPIA